MNLIESIFYMIWRGLAIGVIISAPMGPVGILCIQRTLDKGRRTGFYTGVGAALSDLFYCLLTGFGLSFIQDFLEKNTAVIQLFGSAVLVGFGVYLFKKNPMRNLKRPVGSSPGSPKKNILAGFLFTFSNPLILFLIIGLFARFNFLLPEISVYVDIIGYLFIFAGALLWWWMVTFFIDKVRAHFNIRSMWLINKIIGGVIMIFAVVGLVTGVSELFSASARDRVALPALPNTGIDDGKERIYINPMRGYSLCGGDSVAVPGSNLSIPLNADTRDFQSRLFLKTRKCKYPELSVGGSDGTLCFRFYPEEVSDGISQSPHLVVQCVMRRSGSQDSIVGSGQLPYGRNLSHTLNLLSLDRSDAQWLLSIGTHSQQRMLSFYLPGFDADSISVSAGRKGALQLLNFEAEVSDDYREALKYSPWSDDELLASYLKNSTDPLEGYWSIYDRSLNESLLRMGGDYRFALVRAADGYDLVYLDGARVCDADWSPGRIKAHFIPTPDGAAWNVSWTDASGNLLQHDVKAQQESAVTILLQFPYQSSTLRLIRIEE